MAIRKCSKVQHWWLCVCVEPSACCWWIWWASPPLGHRLPPFTRRRDSFQHGACCNCCCCCCPPSLRVPAALASFSYISLLYSSCLYFPLFVFSTRRTSTPVTTPFLFAKVQYHLLGMKRMPLNWTRRMIFWSAAHELLKSFYPIFQFFILFLAVLPSIIC